MNTVRTDYAQKNRSRARRTQEAPFIAGCSHFTRKNTYFRTPASFPKETPYNIHAATAKHFLLPRREPHISTYMAREHDDNHAAIPLRSVFPGSKNSIPTHIQMHPKQLEITVILQE